jgi:hypothetical protein
MTSWVRLSTPFARKIEAKAMALQAIQAALQPQGAPVQPEEPSAPPAPVSDEPWPQPSPVKPLPFEQPNIKPIPWRVIAEEVACRHGLSVRDLIGTQRAAKVSVARHEAAYCIWSQGHSYAQVGRWLGGRDHTTIIHAVRRHAERNGLALPASSDVR